MFGLITSLNASDRLYFFGYNRDLAGQTPLATNTWYHAAATYDGTRLTLYLNGHPDGAADLDLNTVLNTNGLTIGNRPGRAKWQGQLDEVMLFNRALATNEIAAIYAAGSDGVCHPAAPPELQIQLIDSLHIGLAWTTNSDGFGLESASSLPAASWNPVTNTPVMKGEQYGVVLEMGNVPQFFRLHKP